MAESLLWRSFTEQRGLTYSYQPAYGTSLLILISLGLLAAAFKAATLAKKMTLGDEWSYPWSPGNIVVIFGILIHDLPFSFIIYFFYIKFYSVLSAFQLTLMVFQGKTCDRKTFTYNFQLLTWHSPWSICGFNGRRTRYSENQERSGLEISRHRFSSWPFWLPWF